MGVTKSQANNISSPNGNSLAVFIDGVTGIMFIKDVNGIVEPISNYVGFPSPYKFGSCDNAIQPVKGSNDANANYSVIGGGNSNSSTASYSAISGGVCNTASGNSSFIGGGCNNLANGACSSIIGGSSNNTNNYSNTHIIGSNINACQADTTWTNCISAQNLTAGCFIVVAPNGVLTNSPTTPYAGSIIQIGLGTGSTERCGLSNNASGCYSVVTGGKFNCAFGDFSTISGGIYNCTYSNFDTIAGGQRNVTCSNQSIIGGGSYNITNGNDSTIAGGKCNSTTGNYSIIGGGYMNVSSASNSIVGGGSFNVASCDHSFVGGGYCNISSEIHSSIGGGIYNSVSGRFSSILGGFCNSVTANYAIATGGTQNCAIGTYSVIAGGNNNSASGVSSVISGGQDNVTSGVNPSTIGGGISNIASNLDSTVSGGFTNTSSGYSSTISGGYSNISSNCATFVGGGSINTASGCLSVIGGGANNISSGANSAILGGQSNNTCNFTNAMIIGSSLCATQACTTFMNCASLANLTVGCFVSVGTNKVLTNSLIIPNYGLFAQTTDSTPVTATAVESSLIGVGVGTLSVPANGFSVGNSFNAQLNGIISCVGTATLEIRVKTLAGVLLADTGIIAMDASTAKSWTLTLQFTIRTLGTTGVASISSGGLFSYIKNSGTNFEGFVLTSLNTTTFDTTVNNTLVITAQWNTNNAGNSIFTRNFVLHKIY